MILKQVATGGYDSNFSYVIGNKGKCFIVDPCGDVKKIEKAAKGCEIIYIVNTHSHHDHTDGNEHFLKNGAKLIDEDFSIQGITVKIIRTPGHTKDSKCILVNGKSLITGDTLFVENVGGIFDGTQKELEDSLRKIMTLGDEVEIWPGHDYGSKPSSTIGYEKKNNPFLKFLKC